LTDVSGESIIVFGYIVAGIKKEEHDDEILFILPALYDGGTTV